KLAQKKPPSPQKSSKSNTAARSAFPIPTSTPPARTSSASPPPFANSAHAPSSSLTGKPAIPTTTTPRRSAMKAASSPALNNSPSRASPSGPTKFSTQPPSPQLAPLSSWTSPLNSSSATKPFSPSHRNSARGPARARAKSSSPSTASKRK